METVFTVRRSRRDSGDDNAITTERRSDVFCNAGSDEPTVACLAEAATLPADASTRPADMQPAAT